MAVVFLKSFAAFLGLSLFVAWNHCLHEEKDPIDFDTDNAKGGVVLCAGGRSGDFGCALVGDLAWVLKMNI